MEVKEQNLSLVKMGIIAYLKLFYLKCIRCLSTRKGGCWILGVGGGPEMKTEVLCMPKKNRSFRKYFMLYKHISRPLPSIGIVIT